MIAQPYTLAFYSADHSRLLLLPSRFPEQGIDHVLRHYKIGAVKYVNEFYQGAFVKRHHVALNERTGHCSVQYQLQDDPLLQGIKTASAPLLDWQRILSTDPASCSPTGSESSFFIISFNHFHTNRK